MDGWQVEGGGDVLKKSKSIVITRADLELSLRVVQTMKLEEVFLPLEESSE